MLPAVGEHAEKSRGLHICHMLLQASAAAQMLGANICDKALVVQFDELLKILLG